MTTVVITQPMLFPWPGFFEQLALADTYIYLDDAQYSKGGFTNRVQILHNDTSKWLTIPLAGNGTFQRICDLTAAGEEWRRRHRDFLRQAFSGAPFASSALSQLDRAYREAKLVDLLIASIEESAKALGIGQRRRVLKASDLLVDGRSWPRVLDLVLAVGGTRYLTGHGAANYLDHEAFEMAGVKVEYMRYSLGTWPRGGDNRTPYVSVLDLIAWTGPQAGSYLKPATLPWREFLSMQEREA
jgi:hypothetical protein